VCKRFFSLALLFCLLSPCLSAQDILPESVRFSVIANQEQILVIVSQLNEYYNLQDSIIQSEKKSLQDDRSALTKEKIDFENWKESQEKVAPDLLKLLALQEKQSKQLKIAGVVIKSGGILLAVSIAVNVIHAIAK